jgi:hypothetical protein
VVPQISYKGPERQSFVTNRIKVHGSLRLQLFDYLFG